MDFSKKIIVIVPSLRRCGPTNQLLNIFNALNKSNYQVNLLVLGKNIEVAIPKNVIQYRLQSLCSDLIFNRSSIYLIISQGLLADVTNSLLPFQCGKKYSFIRNVAWIDYPTKFGFKGYIMALLHWISFFFIGNKIFVSKYIGSCYSRFFSGIVLYNSIDINKFYYKERIFRKGCLMTAGSLISRKRIIELSKLVKECVEIDSFHIYGDGPLVKNIESDDRLQVFSHANNIQDIYRMYDVFVSFSLSEGFPNAALEAACCGLPLLLSDIPPHREISERFKYAILFQDGRDFNRSFSRVNDMFFKYDRKVIAAEAKSVFGHKVYSESLQKILNV